ncbi:NAD(P)-dependent oxidoreductase [Dyella sp. GSA-30]|uniref:NAD-dependent epimerase/dehydratase family protein n=1 Tax=Dyella sp. GSA-30 TaxID=2994496 RepID=UPI002492F7B4|nr:NAD(P)-dependent oxidoreductase [Dyella sp. GSA-30]BDU22103.1 dTDP-glucose 4,6-dehydratase [Dyella sp. GSA-30]
MTQTTALPLTILVAGATGVIGSRLLPLLVARGHCVFGTTRTPGKKVDLLTHAGATPVVVDVFDTAALRDAVAAIRPNVVVHQLTDLPRGLDPSRMEEGVRRNAQIRAEGTANLMAAARAAGAHRIVAQSIAWAYAPGNEPFGEDDPLEENAQGLRAISVGGVIALEHAVLGEAGIDGLVLRYGQLWGPGTGADTPDGKNMPLHVDDAAHAAALAVERGRPGIYNIASDSTLLRTDKARQQLGWAPSVHAQIGQ